MYECEDCKRYGEVYCFRGVNKGCQQWMEPVVVSEMFDQFVFHKDFVVEKQFADRVQIERDNGVLFEPIARIRNEEKVNAYWALAERWTVATISDRTVGYPGVSFKRSEWAKDHDGIMVADNFPRPDAEDYGMCTISAYTVKMIYGILEAADLEYKHLSIQKTTAESALEDLAYKAAGKSDAVATDKTMNIWGQITRYHILHTSKSMTPLAQQIVLYVWRLVRNAKKGLGPLTRRISSDCPPVEEARWGPLLPHMKTAAEVRHPNMLRLEAPNAFPLVDKKNKKDLPRYLHDLKESIAFHKCRDGRLCGYLYIDAEWMGSSHSEDGLQLLQMATHIKGLLIRRDAFSSALKVFLESPDLIKVGINMGNDISRLREGHEIALAPTLELGDLARAVYPTSGIWGAQRLLEVFVNPKKIIQGKGTVQCSNWGTHTLSPAQRRYAEVDALLVALVHRKLQIVKATNDASTLLDEAGQRCECNLCKSSNGFAAFETGSGTVCAACYVDQQHPSCVCSVGSTIKCLMCQSSSGPPNTDGSASEFNVGTVDSEGVACEPQCDFTADLFHRIMELLREGGIKHSSHGSGSTTLTMICYHWDHIVYTRLVARMVDRHKVSITVARLMVQHYRRRHPNKVKTTIPVPSILVPLLMAWFDVYGNQYCPNVKRVWLNRPGPREAFDRLILEANQGRIHDQLHIDEIHVVESVAADGTETFKKLRPATSILEGWHEGDIIIDSSTVTSHFDHSSITFPSKFRHSSITIPSHFDHSPTTIRS